MAEKIISDRGRGCRIAYKWELYSLWCVPMECIALYDSGNYAYRICRIFERKGLVFEVIATPCLISHMGCGYCLKFPCEYLDTVLAESLACGCPVREAYKVVDRNNKREYIKIGR
ncbi:MAG TPA: DUF3343 domain-containing protein [Thermoclostridium sp.]|nr:DUF3343 domain-containing protein [Thermoclostridium sp.]